ncbi:MULTISPECIES: hypothetical protein [Mycobacterium avium complex (MAC)]|nr:MULTISPECIES: hypothetical protein [Mycobacterium avium complex (MAC)]EUA17403.1 hypothetical protein I552_0604 [Mycobacterium xenopi 3993]EUA37191.1 hypothetical protein I549_1929 [Mycobacterium avium subsp. avium 2285 (R)]
MTLAEISRESGLRQDLVSRFVPGMDTPSGKLYSAHHVALARYVKELTDLNVPSAAVQVAVHDMESRPQSEFDMILTQSRRRQGTLRGRLWAGIGAAAAAALLIGGIAGGLVGYSTADRDNTTAAAPAPSTVTAPAKPAEISPTIPVTPDPVCAEWAPMHDAYRTQLENWVGVDPRIPSAQWSPDQRAINMAAIPVLRAEATDMRRLAGKAQNQLLKGLMQQQAVYEEHTADAIPGYQPDDAKFWGAVVNFSNAVNALCTATAQK